MEPDNPMGPDGFEFVEYTAPDPEQLRSLFDRMGFPAVARHRSKNVTLHRQADINFIMGLRMSLATSVQANRRQTRPRFRRAIRLNCGFDITDRQCRGFRS